MLFSGFVNGFGNHIHSIFFLLELFSNGFLLSTILTSHGEVCGQLGTVLEALLYLALGFSSISVWRAYWIFVEIYCSRWWWFSRWYVEVQLLLLLVACGEIVLPNDLCVLDFRMLETDVGRSATLSGCMLYGPTADPSFVLLTDNFESVSMVDQGVSQDISPSDRPAFHVSA